MNLNSPTRYDIELILATIPVATTRPARTADKKRARNVRRRAAVEALLIKEFPDPRVRQMILDDLPSYIGFEPEVDDDA
jgi:hypothetical protein